MGCESGEYCVVCEWDVGDVCVIVCVGIDGGGFGGDVEMGV